MESEDVLAFRCADGTDFGVFVSQGRPSGTHTQVTFFCQDVDAEPSPPLRVRVALAHQQPCRPSGRWCRTKVQVKA
jgi:hypothetical protein